MGASKTKRKKRPVAEFNPPGRQVRFERDPDFYRTQTPNWRVGLFDVKGPWSPRVLSTEDWWRELWPKLSAFETMTWQDILTASGGRNRGTNSHEIAVSELEPRAQKRLQELRMVDVDILLSLRLDGRTRLWGIRDGRTLKLLWYDPNHEVCPVASR